LNFTVLRFDSLASTNDEAARQARLSAAEGVCVVARQQTKGRGRRERQWHSPPDAGLYFSLILRPKFPQKNWSLITLAAAAAVCDALKESCNLETDIKWANDIHTTAGKKLSGILAETVDTPNGNAVILGIGINLKKEAVAPQLVETASSIETETGIAPDLETVLAALTANLRKCYQSLHEPDGNAKIIKDWMARSSYSHGKFVRVTLENETFTGKTCGLELDGALRVATENGIIKTVYAGDVVAVRSVKL
jgi:BirA family transcriptional regulator, biotin operon repressor / biotin---[acetyl-CoA-carboxylase] ligase